MDQLDPQKLLKLASMQMPFGKYQGRLLMDLPEPYLLWFANKGWPIGELGQLLQLMLEIRINGLEELLQPLRADRRR
ncbi:DUF3820 family protein [Marinobacterium arenosum]|uniref:DUF3820 family protein n=1 Tax=Marinobacterium arenosum TaxID=2862496 RepID=UPI001C971373|nr:DUF3820 family protein [Marinobacterium arenosum]MBY4678505.1 DUF3820 family protein [Marinobacterium arenosum]